MNQSRIFKIMEIIWLSIAILASLSSAWLISKGQVDSARFPLFTAFCAAVLFGLRRYQRKRIEKVEAFQAENQEPKEKSK